MTTPNILSAAEREQRRLAKEIYAEHRRHLSEAIPSAVRDLHNIMVRGATKSEIARVLNNAFGLTDQPAQSEPSAEMEFKPLVAGPFGTCDWGGCDKSATRIVQGLPICDDCAAKEQAARREEAEQVIPTATVNDKLGAAAMLLKMIGLSAEERDAVCEFCAAHPGKEIDVGRLNARAEQAEQRVKELEEDLSRTLAMDSAACRRADSAESERDSLREQLAASQAEVDRVRSLLSRWKVESRSLSDQTYSECIKELEAALKPASEEPV